MPKFFVDRENISNGKIEISGSDAFHIARSLRMALGDTINISDGCGAEYICTLTKIRDEVCECEIKESVQSTAESPVEITLYMAYPKGDKLETVVQKAVELGASYIVPFESSRCIKRPKAEKQEKQTARLMRIAEEAAKQCGRSKLPKVEHPLSFSEMRAKIKEHTLALFCYEDESGTSIKDVLEAADAPKSIGVIVGSEGGFSPEEAALIKESGARAVSLGVRILRCETAPDYALSAISYRFEL